MRVVGGEARGRRFAAPPGRLTRPTSDRVREAIFGVLGSLPAGLGGRVEEATVADLFAGSGALGLEALSRGAAHVVFVDSDREAVATINGNLADLGWAEPGRPEVRPSSRPGPVARPGGAHDAGRLPAPIPEPGAPPAGCPPPANHGPDRRVTVSGRPVVASRAVVVRGDALRWLRTAGPTDLVLCDPPYAFDRWPDLVALLAPVAGLVVMETGAPLELGAGWDVVREKHYGGTVVVVARPGRSPEAARDRKGDT